MDKKIMQANMPKLFVEVRSGLGNQLFQYAVAFSLALRYQRELVICPRYFDPYWKYLLKKISGREFRSFRLPFILNMHYRVLYLQNETQQNVTVLSEDTPIKIFHLELAGKRDIYLKGYWQNPHLFLAHLRQFQEIFKPVFRLSKRCSGILRKIEPHVVAIHVRRGDFLINSAFGACNIEYYKNAVEIVGRSIENPSYIVFTNDRAWVRKNFKFNIRYMVYSDCYYAHADIEEMFLLTKIPTLIISNSTFSWWGAFLNDQPRKMIICPSTWYRKREMQMEASKFVLDKWLPIDNLLELSTD